MESLFDNKPKKHRKHKKHNKDKTPDQNINSPSPDLFGMSQMMEKSFSQEGKKSPLQTQEMSMEFNSNGKKAHIKMKKNGKVIQDKNIKLDKHDLAKLLSVPSSEGLLHERLFNDFSPASPLSPHSPHSMPVIMVVKSSSLPQPIENPVTVSSLSEELSRATTPIREKPSHTKKQRKVKKGGIKNTIRKHGRGNKTRVRAAVLKQHKKTRHQKIEQQQLQQQQQQLLANQQYLEQNLQLV